MASPKKYTTSLFVFRRDHRIDDNPSLHNALAESKSVIPCFIFDPRQVSDKNNYKSSNAIQFMIASLEDVDDQLSKKKGSLQIFHGIAHEVIEKLIATYKIDAVYCNRDYTPFSIKRDKEIEKICARYDVAFEQYTDALLNQPEDIKTSSSTPYTVFTPFYKYCFKNFPIAKPTTTRLHNFSKTKLDGSISLSSIKKELVPSENKNIHVMGGRSYALKILKKISEFKDYDDERDIPSIATTNLSAYLKFGCISVREVAHAISESLGKHHTLIKQLYWRDFYMHIAYHSPYVFGQSFHKKYDSMWWKNDKKDFRAWCEGTTGFPIVDAGMRQLNTTGYMHNRVRMIVASFLTKDLHIDWRWGEKYFAQQLVDYDPALNNGNWQWSASTGCDAQPYFRIFNPWLQQKKFDPDCTYIKTWIPELQDIEPKIIHNWFKESGPDIPDYPRPIVDHTEERAIALKAYKRAK